MKILSYPIEQGGPNWPGNPDFTYQQCASIAKGDSCNTYLMTIFNHIGTHFDAPNHYNKDGAQIAQLPFERFVYEKPLLIDLPKQADEKITAADLAAYEKQLAESDLLMIRTGWTRQRKEETELYCNHGPAVSAEAARYLMDHFGDTLKAVALDFLSLACPADTKDGDEAHRNLLGVYHPGKAICVIEDCNFDELTGEEKKIYAIPLRIIGVDSCPVTMFTED